VRLGEIMTHPVTCISPEEAAVDAFELMARNRIHHLLVVDRRKVVGVLSERDLGGPRGASLRKGRSVADLMTRDVVVASTHTTFREAANLLRGRSIGCLPVMEDGRPVGIVTLSDLLEIAGRVSRRASTDARWKPVRRMGRWPRATRRPSA